MANDKDALRPATRQSEIITRNTDDLPDSDRDAQRLKPDEGTLDLPDVSDIPGQEHVTVLPLGDLGDTTAASDDEEGTSLLGD